MPDPVKREDVECDYLAEGGDDLKQRKRAFLSVDLVHGRMRTYAADEYADTTPALVGCGWHMRWPIPPIDNDRANQLMKAVSDSVDNLFRMTAIRGEEDALGVILYGGAGTSVDLIQRECAEAWRAHYEDRH